MGTNFLPWSDRETDVLPINLVDHAMGFIWAFHLFSSKPWGYPIGKQSLELRDMISRRQGD
jgi:hypothetical protein